MASGSNTGREGGMLTGLGNVLAGLQAGGFKDKGLAGAAPEEIGTLKSQHDPANDAPSKEMQAKYGNVEKVAPSAPVDAAKQDMQRERGSTFTESSGAHVLHPGQIDNRKFM